MAYASRTLRDNEKSWFTTEKECLSLVEWVKHWRPYLHGRQFKVQTDHRSLIWVFKQQDTSERLMRWVLSLQEYDMVIEHKPGQKHKDADLTSRPVMLIQPSSTEGRGRLNRRKKRLRVQMIHHIDRLLGQSIPARKMARKQEKDETLNDAWRKASEGHRGWKVIDDCLHREATIKGRTYMQLALPQKLRKKVMEAHHDGVLGGHLGSEKTLSRIQKTYWWPGITDDVEKWIRTCRKCQERKAPRGKLKGKMKAIRVARAWEMLGIDIITSLPRTETGCTNLVVVSDYFTKWVEAFPTRDTTSNTIARLLIDRVFTVYGFPEALMSDQGRQFTSALTKEICRALGIKKKFTTAYHPQTDGLVERNN